jgi:hypothetical protein
MSDSMTQLCRSAQLRRARWDKVAWCPLSIELKAISRQDRCFVGVALIDHRQVGYLINGEPRSFKLEPGEHTVTVYLARTARFAVVKQKVISRRVVLGPGEHVGLVCGTEKGARGEWRAYQTAQQRLTLAIIPGPILFGGLGWLIFPFLREAIADVTLRLGLGEPWLSLWYLPVRWRAGLAVFAFLAWFSVIFTASQVRLLRLMHRPEFRSMEPYFLVKVASR